MSCACTTMLSVDTIQASHPGIKPKTVRKWIENSRDRTVRVQDREIKVKGNGFDKVIVRVGRRIFLDNRLLIEWMRERNQTEEQNL